MEIGHRQATALPAHEPRGCGTGAGGGLVAIRKHAVFGQGLSLGLHHMRAGKQAFEVIAAIGVGDRKAAVFQHHAHAGNAAPARFHHARTFGDPPDQGHPVPHRFAFDRQHCAGHAALAAQIGRLGAVERIAFGRIRAHGHRIGDPVSRACCQFGEANGQGAAISRDGDEARRGLTIDPHGIRAQPQPPRRRIHHHHITLGPRGIGIANLDRVEHAVAGHGVGARHGLAQSHRHIGPVNRNIHPHWRGRGERQHAAVRSIGQEERLTIRTRQARKLRCCNLRGRDIWRRWFHHQPVRTQRSEREAVFARQKLVHIARRIGDRLAAYHRGWPACHPVIGEHCGGLARGAVDHADPRARHRRAVFAIKHKAERIGQHQHRSHRDRAFVASAVFDGNNVAHGHAQAAIALCGQRRDGSGAHSAHEHAAIGGGFEHHEFFAVARGGDKDHQHLIDCGRIVVGARRGDAEHQIITDLENNRPLNRCYSAAITGHADAGQQIALADGGIDRSGGAAIHWPECLDQRCFLHQRKHHCVGRGSLGGIACKPLCFGNIGNRLRAGGARNAQTRDAQQQRPEERCCHCIQDPLNWHYPTG